MGSEDRVHLIQTVRGPGSMSRRPRSGLLILTALCSVLLTVLFYLCSLDYQSLAIEKKLLRYHESLLKTQMQDELEVQLLREQEGQNGSSTDVLHNEIIQSPANSSGHSLSAAESEYEQHVKQMFEHKNSVSSFDIRKNDVIVFLQIQNTGSSLLEQKMVKDLVLERPCACVKRRCPCLRPVVKDDKDEDEDEDDGEQENRPHDSYWLFSRLSVGWACGFHSDWSEMTYCVDPALDQIEGRRSKRRYFFMTQLRDPVKRFLSEFYRWTRMPAESGSNTVHTCRGKQVQVVDRCNMTQSITMQEWISCPYNLALNRQTRMLADLSLVDCYNYSSMSRADRNLILLNSAKANLHKMAFFSLSEYPRVSMKLFEFTFGLKFLPSMMEQVTDLKWTGKKIRGQSGRDLPDELVELIREANRLDIELYDYAKSLLFDRFNQMETQHLPSSSAGKFLQSMKDHKDLVKMMKKKKPSNSDGNTGSDDNESDEEDETF